MTLMEKIGTPIGHYAPDFELLGIDDNVHHLSRYLENWKAIAVIFMSNHCPYVAAYLDRLKRLQAEFADQGFTLVGINGNDANQYPEESLAQMKQFAREKQLNFPYLCDSTQDVAQGFGAEKTPEVFLIDERGILRYSGQIDDNPQDPKAVQVSYLKNAIAALLVGDAISPQSTPAMGSDLVWRH